MVQQSNPEWPAGQLLLPQTKSPVQSELWSQSPSPRPHCEEDVQQDQSLFAGAH